MTIKAKWLEKKEIWIKIAQKIIPNCIYEVGDMSKETISIWSKVLDVVTIHFIDKMNKELE